MIARHNILRSVLVRQRRFCYNQSHVLASLVAAASVSALVSSSDATGENRQNRTLHLHLRTRPSNQICECEGPNGSATSLQQEITKPTALKPLSRLTRILYASKLYPYSYLPVPRILTPSDPLFSYPKLKRGLLRRCNDEEKMKRILSSPELMEARKEQNQAQMKDILEQMNNVVYGEGVTPQIRENFLIQYGCTGYTDEILQYLVQTFGHRGLVEVGSGNGQWARALSDYHELMQKQLSQNTPNKSWEFILAYDNMKQLPLSPKVYHKQTLPANKFFFDKVKCASHIDAVQGSRGRVLLLVYPPPGPMALETVEAYLNASLGYSGSYKNDTVIYVGEGRGGANANGAFFDYFLGGDEGSNGLKGGQRQWVLDKVMDVQNCPGDKGYEKLFVFRRK